MELRRREFRRRNGPDVPQRCSRCLEPHGLCPECNDQLHGDRPDHHGRGHLQLLRLDLRARCLQLGALSHHGAGALPSRWHRNATGHGTPSHHPCRQRDSDAREFSGHSELDGTVTHTCRDADLRRVLVCWVDLVLLESQRRVDDTGGGWIAQRVHTHLYGDRTDQRSYLFVPGDHVGEWNCLRCPRVALLHATAGSGYQHHGAYADLERPLEHRWTPHPWLRHQCLERNSVGGALGEHELHCHHLRGHRSELFEHRYLLDNVQRVHELPGGGGHCGGNRRVLNPRRAECAAADHRLGIEPDRHAASIGRHPLVDGTDHCTGRRSEQHNADLRVPDPLLGRSGGHLADLVGRAGICSDGGDQLGRYFESHCRRVLSLQGHADLLRGPWCVFDCDLRSAQRSLIVGCNAGQRFNQRDLAGSQLTRYGHSQRLRGRILRNWRGVELPQWRDRNVHGGCTWIPCDTDSVDHRNLADHHGPDQWNDLRGPGHAVGELPGGNRWLGDRHAVGNCRPTGAVPDRSGRSCFNHLELAGTSASHRNHGHGLPRAVLHRWRNLDHLPEPQHQPLDDLSSGDGSDERHAVLLPGHSDLLAQRRNPGIRDGDAAGDGDRPHRTDDLARGTFNDSELDRPWLAGRYGADRVPDPHGLLPLGAVDHGGDQHRHHCDLVSAHWPDGRADRLLRGGRSHRRRRGRLHLTGARYTLRCTERTDEPELRRR